MSLPRNRNSLSFSRVPLSKIAEAAAALDAAQLETEIREHCEVLGTQSMIQRRDLREQKQGALAAVRATIARMQSAAAAAAAADSQAMDEAVRSSSLGHVFITPASLFCNNLSHLSLYAFL